MHEQIYAELEQLLVPAKLPSGWDSLPAPPGYLESPPLLEQQLAPLLERFLPADLLAAGVLVAPQEAGTQPQLHPLLQASGSKWLALRETPDSPPFDLLTDRGALSGRLPVVAALEDHLVSTLLIQGFDDLLVAATVADAAVLLAAGLPTTISAGLQNLQHDTLREFCEAFQLFRPGDPRRVKPSSVPADKHGRGAVDDGPPHLIVVGWSPAQLSLEVAIQIKVRDYLESLYTQAQIPTQDFSWWRPADDSLSKIIFAVNTLDMNSLRDVLIENLEYCESLARPAPQKTTPPKPVSEVFAKAAKQSFLNPLASAQRAEERRKLLEKEVFAPLLEATNQASNDPLQRNLQLAHLQVSMIYHNYLGRVCDVYSPANKTWDEDDKQVAKLSQMPLLLDNLLKLTRELRGQSGGRS